MSRVELLDFDEKFVEPYCLSCLEDFDVVEDNFLDRIKQKDGELEFVLNSTVEKKLKELMEVMPFPLTIIYDPYYVDRVYRDEYYAYFSKKHFNILRNTKRLIFVRNEYVLKDFLDDDEIMHEKIERDIIGMVVLKPTQTIGRTLISPFHIKIPQCYVRTTGFEISVLGKIYLVEAFPVSGQDSEVMTCAEVNIWQIMEYFGNRYDNYRTLLPSEMLEMVMDISDVRLLPSDGLTVEQESHIFMKNGLSPKIYYKRLECDNGKYVGTYEQYPSDPSYKDILHFYVESGVPVLLNLREKGNGEGDNHSITVIGHAAQEALKIDETIIHILKTGVDKRENQKYNELTVYKTWSDTEGYVLMEDHSVPYQIKSLNDLRFGDNETSIQYEIESFVVPLYKHVFMAAEDAYAIVINLIEESYEIIIEGLEQKKVSDPYKIVIRLFLTTSKAYKEFRVRTAKKISEKVFFSQVAYPKFIWICEYGTDESFNNHMAYGEFVLDATSSRHVTTDSIISFRHGKAITYRGPVEPRGNAMQIRNVPVDDEYSMFEQNNLKITDYEGRLGK